MRITDFLSQDFVVAELGARDMEGVLQEVSAKASEAGLGEAAMIAERLLERERQHTTVVGAGIAIPHATIPELSTPVVGIALSPDPVRFGPPDQDPVRLFFVVLSPPGTERQHVKILARLCRLGKHEDLVERLAGAADGDRIVQVIEAVDAQHV